MDHRKRALRSAFAFAGVALTVVALAACGSSSGGDATSLLRQTFSGTHKYDSGNLNVNLTVTPSGSSTFSTPITFTIAGPFQSLGAGKPPQAAITLSVSALGRTGSLGFISTGDRGFVTLSGQAYELPAATFQKYASGLTGLTSSTGSGSGSGLLGKLGVDPLKWVVHPTVAGTESVGGADTTHVTAAVNVAALLKDLNTLLAKGPSLGIGKGTPVPTGISPATQAKLSSQIKNPAVDVWTGNSDKTARKLAIKLTVPVSGQISQLLGGLSSAAIGLSMQYANLNQPQTISAPTNLRPYSEFTAKVRAFTQALGGALSSGSTTGSAGTSTGSSTTAAPTTAAPANVQSYTRCIQAAGSDVGKMQQCAGLLQKK
jgi:hypothetical protein